MFKKQETFEPRPFARGLSATSWQFAGMLSLVTGVNGCADIDEPSPAPDLESYNEPLYVDTSSLWHIRQVSVCWINRDPRAEVHEWVRAAVERTWEFAANIDVVGWSDCGPTGTDIRISVGDALGPQVTGLGTGLKGMRLNFLPGSRYCGFGHPDETYRSCMEFIAIHEFGHALGFAHEQNRDDTPAACMEAPQGSDGTETFGSWDWDSVMNYCNPAYAAHPSLSGSDVAGAQHYYGVSGRYLAALVALM